MTLQSQKVANEKYKFFQKFWFLRSNYCCSDKSDGLSYHDLTHSIIKETTEVVKKRDGSRENSDAFQS